MSKPSSAPRPKRAREEFSRVSLHEGVEPSSKKARFDARNPSTLVDDTQEEDPILDLDVIGTKGTQAKRNAVELDGFESDSSNENFDRRAEAKAALEKKSQRNQDRSMDEDANDMFADLDDDFADGDDDEDISKEGKKQKKEVRFLDENEIEGQVNSSKAGGHVSADFSLNSGQKDQENESSSEESGGEEERDRLEEGMDEELGAGSKKKHAPKLDAFNMKNEAEEGRFDDSGNFIRKATDPFAVHDSWLEGATKAEMKRAKEAQEKREQEQRQRDLADDAVSTSDIISILISHLLDGETVIEALARLGSSKPKKSKPKWQKNKRKQESSPDVDMAEHNAPDDPTEAQRKATVEAITAAADQMLARDQPEIYDTERGLLMRQYKRETGEAWVDKHTGHPAGVEDTNEQKQWEFRWSDARDGGEHHGPFDGKTMKAWNDAGYFAEGVEFKQVGTDEWAGSVAFV